jgi:nicotinamidase-related amidase
MTADRPIDHVPDEIQDRVDERFLNVDPLKPSYREMLDTRAKAFEEQVHERTALLCIDMQYLDAARGYGVFAETGTSGVPAEAQDYYFAMLERVVLPNVARLQEAFRQRGLEVIHTRIQSLTRDGRDRGLQHRRLGLHAAPGSKEAEILPEVAPKGDEIVMNKTASGVFSSTNLDFVLRNMNIEALVVVGVYTDECVASTARHASDLGYDTMLIEDACASVTEERTRFSLETMRNRYVRVMTTDALLEQLKVLGAGAL